ncbi:MAG TPA: hypothetical protein VK558_05830 [Patescibacteria group bacterium]|nr:hypothetical protein [Patescibacteria group bacterium]
MVPRYILKEIESGSASEEEANNFLDKALYAPETAEHILMLSHTEWTAKCHGVSLGELAEWRYHGWPNRCIVCGKEIDVEHFGWLATELDDLDRSLMKHVVCP